MLAPTGGRARDGRRVEGLCVASWERSLGRPAPLLPRLGHLQHHVRAPWGACPRDDRRIHRSSPNRRISSASQDSSTMLAAMMEPRSERVARTWRVRSISARIASKEMMGIGQLKPLNTSVSNPSTSTLQNSRAPELSDELVEGCHRDRDGIPIGEGPNPRECSRWHRYHCNSAQPTGFRADGLVHQGHRGFRPNCCLSTERRAD